MKIFQLYQKEILAFGCCFFLIVLLSFVVSDKILQKYKESFLENQAFFIQELVLEHPELESEIVEILRTPHQDSDLSFFKKYGFTDFARLSYLDYVKNLENATRKILVFAFLFSFFLLYLF